MDPKLLLSAGEQSAVIPPGRVFSLFVPAIALSIFLVACGNHSATAPKPETSPQGETHSAPAAQPDETAKPEAPVTEVQFIDEVEREDLLDLLTVSGLEDFSIGSDVTSIRVISICSSGSL